MGKATKKDGYLRGLGAYSKQDDIKFDRRNEDGQGYSNDKSVFNRAWKNGNRSLGFAAKLDKGDE
jgi:hypothetical protein